MYVYRKPYLIWTLVVVLGMSLYYFCVEKVNEDTLIESKDFLIHTPGCSIPNYAQTFTYNESITKVPDVRKAFLLACGERAIFVDYLANNRIKFRMDKKKMEKYFRLKAGTKVKRNYNCCYKLVHLSTTPENENEELAYTKCKSINKVSKISPKDEIIVVYCFVPSKGIRIKIYEDVFINIWSAPTAAKKLSPRGPWNILMLGISAMSRTRIFDTMPLTSNYLKTSKWLDYKAYQKMEFNTYSNLMSVMSGENMSTITSRCSNGLHKCADFFIWNKFINASYKTAYGEDNLSLHNVISECDCLKTQSTDHYMRPFYLIGERRYNGVLCMGKKPSATHILEYAHNFVDVYKNQNHFGFFWINSYSNNFKANPSYLDEEIVKFFETLNKTGIMENTFVIFFSDNGIRFGEKKRLIESYYDERLPMLFIWTPHKFRKQYIQKYQNLYNNQNRLTTPIDLHLTLADILRLSTNSSEVIKSEACPQCTSLFEIKSSFRTCADAGINDHLCSCYKMSKGDAPRTNNSLAIAISHIEQVLKNVKTIPCMLCQPLKLRALLRSHIFHGNNGTYSVAAFSMSSDSSKSNLEYEAIIFKSNVLSVQSISSYNIQGNCVLDRNFLPYCICTLSEKCIYDPDRFVQECDNNTCT